MVAWSARTAGTDVHEVILSFQGANDVLTVTNEVIQSLWSSLLQAAFCS